MTEAVDQNRNRRSFAVTNSWNYDEYQIFYIDVAKFAMWKFPWFTVEIIKLKLVG